jgi:hypothetical protein
MPQPVLVSQSHSSEHNTTMHYTPGPKQLVNPMQISSNTAMVLDQGPTIVNRSMQPLSDSQEKVQALNKELITALSGHPSASGTGVNTPVKNIQPNMRYSTGRINVPVTEESSHSKEEVDVIQPRDKGGRRETKIHTFGTLKKNQ